MAQLSESEEMYLVKAVQLAELGAEEPIPLSRLAQALSIQAVSVNQMVRKLEAAGYVEYRPYKGVKLLPDGLRLAHRVLRRRRLWELFLVEHLDVSPSEADALACRLEHFTPADVAERLYRYLEEPQVSPQGLPIPPGDEDVVVDPPRPLSQLNVGDRAEVVHADVDAASSAFLQAEGIQPGSAIAVLAIGSEGACLLQGGEGRVTVSNELAARLLVRPRAESAAIAVAAGPDQRA